jgi:hypothetical protein
MAVTALAPARLTCRRATTVALSTKALRVPLSGFRFTRLETMKKLLLSALCVLTVAVLAAGMSGCGGGGGSEEPAMGRITVAITDAPVDDATAVVVKFTAIELKPEDGDAFTIELNPAQSIDLLALAGGSSRALLEERSVPAGHYSWIRLLVETQANQPSSYIDLDSGERFPLVVPSGSESGLKLIRGFTVAVGSVSNFTIDFDLRKSVIAPPGQSPNYLLKPALRMVDNLQVGIIAGTVAPALITDACEPVVYVFSGANVTPDDLDSTAAPDVDPLVSVPVTLDATSGEYRFRASFVEVGAYTASFTCHGDLDTPEGEEVLSFAGTQNVNVSANQTTAIDFAP